MEKDLTAIITQLFPKWAPMDVSQLVKVFGAFLMQEFEKGISHIPEIDQAKTVRPFLNLVSGICYLQETNRILQQLLLTRSETGLTGEPTQFQGPLKELYESAQREFDNGLAIDNSYIPIHIDLIKMKLSVKQAGEKIPEALLEQIRTYVDQFPEIYQFHYLLGLALKKEREYLITKDTKIITLSEMIMEERSSLRKAIQGNPSYVDAYIALAETYVISWRLYTSKISAFHKTFSKLGSPEFGVAIQVLERASPTPKVLDLLAQFYQASKEPEKSVKYHKALLEQYPSWTRVEEIIQSYITLGDLAGGRDWLKKLDHISFPDQNFDINRLALIAVLDTIEADSASISDERREFLEKRQIKNYRLALEKAKDANIDPPVEVVNNLAYLLSEKGEVLDARELIEPIIARLDNLKHTISPQQLKGIEESYAWILSKSGEHSESAKIYQRLCAKETHPEIHGHYAQVLYKQRQYEKALEQVEIILKSKQQSATMENEARRLKEKINTKLKKQEN